jgi:hypothetical protein
MATTEHITTAAQLLEAPGLGRCELVRGGLLMMSPTGSFRDVKGKQMGARFLLAAVAVVFASGMVWGAEAPKAPLVYELTVDGQTYELSDAGQFELNLDGKTYRVSVRVKPIQHYATGALEFDYDKSLALRDDQDKEGRTINMVHGSSASIVVTELGEATAGGPKPTLAHLAERMEARFKRGVCKDLQKSPDAPVQFKSAKGSTLTLTYKDEDDDLQTCKIYALESKNRRFSVIVQYGSEEKNVAEPMAQLTLDSITAK